VITSFGIGVLNFICSVIPLHEQQFFVQEKKEFNSPVEFFVHKACKMYCKYICVTFMLIYRFELSNFETMQ
jgi:hypothetical protein